MKQFYTFVRKEFIHILRDPRTLMILIGMPIVEMLIFGFALNMDVSNIRTMIVTPAQDDFTRSLISKVGANPYFILKEVTPDISMAYSQMRKGEVDMVLVLPSSFHTDLLSGDKPSIQIMVDSSDPNIGTISTNYMSQLISTLFPEGEGLPYSIQVNPQMMYNPQMKSSYNFVPGIMALVLIIICTIMTSVSIAREKERGTMEVLLVSPVRPAVMIMSKTIPYFFISAINIFSILLLSYYVLEVPIRGALWLILLLTVVYVFLALLMGVLISSLVQHQKEAIIISGFGMMMPTMILSGMIFPIQNMPLFLQWISAVVPARWYIDAIRKVMIQGIGFQGVWSEMTILLAMCVFVFLYSLFNIKPHLK